MKEKYKIGSILRYKNNPYYMIMVIGFGVIKIGEHEYEYKKDCYMVKALNYFFNDGSKEMGIMREVIENIWVYDSVSTKLHKLKEIGVL